MPKTANCEACLCYAQDSHLVCAVHPDGHNSDFCPDFQADPDLGKREFVDFLRLLQIEGDRNCHEPFSNPFSLGLDHKQWEPKGATYYNGKLIL